ncbi:MAG: hypothetical protein ABIH67_01415 [Candidatus Uhrbacteria bacterium]
MAPPEQEVTICKEASQAFCLFLQSELGPPTDEQGRIRYPDIFGVLEFLNQAKAPGHVQAAAIISCYNMAGGPPLDYQKRLRILGHRGQSLADIKLRPGAGRVSVEDRIHEFCQMLDRQLCHDRLMLVCALVNQFLKQIILNHSRQSSCLHDLLRLMHDQLIKFPGQVTEMTRDQIVRLLETVCPQVEAEVG